MRVHEIISSSIAASRIHLRKAYHLRCIASSPSPVIRIAANAMLADLRKDPLNLDFSSLEYDFRVAGHVGIADAIRDLSEILNDMTLNIPKWDGVRQTRTSH